MANAASKKKPVKAVKKSLAKKTAPKAKPKKTVAKKIPPKKIIKKIAKKAIAIKKTAKRALQRKGKPAELKRAPHNPIIEPRLYPWESKAAFNPTAFESKGKVHIIYRAIGEDDSSALGYARSDDGMHISERAPHFVYKRFKDRPDFSLPLFFSSGGGWGGGCEDPRLTRIGDIVYLLYTAFDGWGSVRIALTSMPLADFERKKWKWEKTIFISPPGEINKNWTLFPDKINGKFAVLHSISPKVLIDYVDDWQKFSDKDFIKSISHHDRERNVGETGIRGVGPSPMKTRLGWLVLYHVTEPSDPGRYKLYALILDKNDPTKVLYRSKGAILAPDERYENEGNKWGIIYSCGAVIKDQELFVYYGGADTVGCVASIQIEELLQDLTENRVITLKKDSFEKI